MVLGQCCLQNVVLGQCCLQSPDIILYASVMNIIKQISHFYCVGYQVYHYPQNGNIPRVVIFSTVQVQYLVIIFVRIYVMLLTTREGFS